MKKILFLGLVVFLLSSCNQEYNGINNADLPTGFGVSNVQNSYDLVYGGAGNNDDEHVSGMVVNNDGEMFVSMNVTTTQADENLIITKLNFDGTLAWGKQYNSTNEKTPDSGENGETGGTAGSISIDADGNIYIIATETIPLTNDVVLIVKINGSTSDIMWQKRWKLEWPDDGGYGLGYQVSEGYALDATGDYLYFTGACGSNQVLVVALNKNDGSLFYQYALDLVSGTKDRGYAIKQDASGNLFIGGVTGSYAYIAKIIGGNTATPTLAWVKNAGLSFGARINGLDIDDTGVYYSCDIRGVETFFEILKIDFDGNLQWAKSYPGSSDDRNNTHVVHVSGDYVYAGGRTGQSGMDALGDALLVKLSKDDGSLVWSGIYTTGSINIESASQRIKGIAFWGGEVYLAGQIYPANANSEHYYGAWVENNYTVTDQVIYFSDITADSFDVFPDGEIRDGEGTMSDYNMGILQNSKDKVATNTPDCDAFMMKFNFDVQ